MHGDGPARPASRDSAPPKPRVFEARLRARATPYAKQRVAESMYVKGKNFLGAAILLRQKGGYEYVVLHLLCQAIEITLKAVLLLRAYDRYKAKLKGDHGGYGHDLEALADAVVAEFDLRSLSPGLKAELQALNALYKSHQLRYGTLGDIFVDPTTIPSRRVLRRMKAMLPLAERYFAKALEREQPGTE